MDEILYHISKIKYLPALEHVKSFYSLDNERTKRGNIKKIFHIYEGLLILQGFKVHVNKNILSAWCLHPLIQDNDSFTKNYKSIINYNSETVLNCVEYRNIANQYLCKVTTDHYRVEDVPVMTSSSIHAMLVADKISNYYNLIKNHENHNRYNELDYYFNNWLESLGVGKSDLYLNFKKIEELHEFMKDY